MYINLKINIGDSKLLVDLESPIYFKLFNETFMIIIRSKIKNCIILSPDLD